MDGVTGEAWCSTARGLPYCWLDEVVEVVLNKASRRLDMEGALGNSELWGDKSSTCCFCERDPWGVKTGLS